jgi:hypothetical protein
MGRMRTCTSTGWGTCRSRCRSVVGVGLWTAGSLGRLVTGPFGHWAVWSLGRLLTGPIGLWTTGSLGRVECAVWVLGLHPRATG